MDVLSARLRTDGRVKKISEKDSAQNASDFFSYNFCTTSPSRTGGLEARLRTANRIALDMLFFNAVVISKISKFQNMMSTFIENFHLTRAQPRESTSVFLAFPQVRWEHKMSKNMAKKNSF